MGAGAIKSKVIDHKEVSISGNQAFCEKDKEDEELGCLGQLQSVESVDWVPAEQRVHLSSYEWLKFVEENFLNENNLQNEAPSTTTLFDLPLEILDIILQKSYLHGTLNLPKQQRFEESISSLMSVDVCFYQRIMRQRFKKTSLRFLKVFYEKVQKSTVIIRSNRTYLLQNIQPNDEFIGSMFTLHLITEEQRNFIQRQRSNVNKNSELLHVLRSFDDKQFSKFQRCLRQTNQTAVAEIIKNGGVAVKVGVRNCGMTVDPQLLYHRIRNLQTRIRSQEIDELIRQLKEQDIEILDNQQERETSIVWIWCHSQTALDVIKRLYESNELISVFFGLTNAESTVINIDQNEFRKTVVVACPISVICTDRINVGEKETVAGVTKLRNEIYILCQLFPQAIYVFEGRNSFRCKREIGIIEIEDPKDIGSSEREDCLYVTDQRGKCVWKITTETDYDEIIIRWLQLDYAPRALSVSSNGNLLLLTSWPFILNTYGPDAELIRSIQLPRDIEEPIHVVETSIGNCFILHQLMEHVEQESESSGKMRESMWVVSEVSKDGLKVILRFTPSEEIQKLKNPRYLTFDANDRVFVADTENDRVILLDSALSWNRSLYPLITEEHEEERAKIRMPLRLAYDKGMKQLIVGGGYFFYLGAVHIYNLI